MSWGRAGAIACMVCAALASASCSRTAAVSRAETTAPARAASATPLPPAADATPTAGRPLRQIAGLAAGVSHMWDAVGGYGQGLFVSDESHVGGRYYTDSKGSVTLHVTGGTDEVIDEVGLSDGVALPAGVHSEDATNLVAPALSQPIRIDRGVALGMTMRQVTSLLGEPTHRQGSGILRSISYMDSREGDFYVAQLLFVRDRLRSITIYCGE